MKKIKKFFSAPFVQQQIARFVRLFLFFFTPAAIGMYHSGHLNWAALGVAAGAALELAWKGTWPYIKVKYFPSNEPGSSNFDSSDDAQAS
jgi:hypothetical protein